MRDSEVANVKKWKSMHEVDRASGNQFKIDQWTVSLSLATWLAFCSKIYLTESCFDVNSLTKLTTIIFYCRWENWFMATFVCSVLWIVIYSYVMVWMVKTLLWGFSRANVEYSLIYSYNCESLKKNHFNNSLDFW